MRLLGRGAVEVGQVGVAGGAELADVEAGVAADQRVERPGHQVEALGQHTLALRPLEPLADAGVAVAGAHGGHVRGVLEAPVWGAGQEAEDEAEQGRGGGGRVEGAEHEPAVLLDGEQHVVGHDAERPPDLALELLAGQVLGVGGNGANGDIHWRSTISSR